jgi:penicillin G amidase
VVSWAFTVAPVDLVDDYKEVIEGADTPAPRVRTAEGWAPVEVRAETIAVKDAPARVVRLLRTPRGPVLSMQGDTALVMHWAGYDFPAWSVAAGAEALMRMRDFESFRRTVANTGALSVNWTYADKQGNIGYQLGAPIPVRDGYDTFTPQWGTDPRAWWRGYRPLEERPFALNPAQGWLATTNDQVVGDRYAYAIPGYYHLTRKTRIAAILDSATRGSAAAGTAPNGTLDVAAMTRAQRDLISGNAVRWRALAAIAAEQAGNAAAAESLREWDGRLGPKDVPATLWAYWWQRLPRELFEDELGDDWARAVSLTVAALSDSAGAFVDDVRTPERESLEMIATRAMRAALAEDWDRPFGAVQTLTVKHPLASVAVLDRWLGLTRGPVPIGGDDATLDAAFSRFDTATRTLHDEAGPSMRFVMDWADVDGFTLSRHLGQSGNPLSPHFSDFLAPHLAGEPWPMPFTRSKVEARTVKTLRLVPD